MNDKQKRFCEEYVTDLNGAQAAIRAGYSEVSAKQIANRILSIPSVRDYVKEIGKELADYSLINSQRVVSKLTEIAFDDEQRTPDQLRALTILAKHLHMFDEAKSSEEIKQVRIVSFCGPDDSKRIDDYYDDDE